MVDAINNNSNTLLRAQAASAVTPKVTTPAQTVISNLQKNAAVPVKNTAVPQARRAGSSSGNLPRGSLIDILA